MSLMVPRSGIPCIIENNFTIYLPYYVLPNKCIKKFCSKINGVLFIDHELLTDEPCIREIKNSIETKIIEDDKATRKKNTSVSPFAEHAHNYSIQFDQTKVIASSS